MENEFEKEPSAPVGQEDSSQKTEERHPRVQRERIPRAERIDVQNHEYNSYGHNRPYQSQDQRSYGYRPSYQRAERPYREGRQDRSYSRYQDERPQYSPREGYQPRPAGQYRRNDYSTRQGDYQPRQSGYQPRSEEYQSRQGGYQPRSGYQNRRPNNPRAFQQRPNGNGRGPARKPQRPTRPRTADYDPSAKYNTQKILRFKEQNIDPTQPMRLNRYLANAGLCSRREADKYIQSGLVTVNGEVVTELGHKVLRTDTVLFKDTTLSLQDKVYVLLNKPKNYVTTLSDQDCRKTVMELVQQACPERLCPVGRLDRNTTGVLLLTNDGEMAEKLMHPKYKKKKIYHVLCNKPVSFADMQKILEGIMLEDGEIKADRIEYASETDRKQIGIEIHSGRNRIVRRIFENLGYRVVKLDRVFFAGLTKKYLRRGHWRYLTEAEVNMLRMGAYE